ncbi:MAG: hypothetical protein GTO62_11855, partial [Planctomycetales bacterium]|nr:hypothetical protein [Planctomycetales bacterium]NIP69954.1 hypothetical protein [Planctomycetales bacterium]
MKHAMLALAAALLLASSGGCHCLKYGRQACRPGCLGDCDQCGPAAAEQYGVDHHGDCQCAECLGGGAEYGVPGTDQLPVANSGHFPGQYGKLGH